MRDLSIGICWCATLILFVVSMIVGMDIRWSIGSGVFFITFTQIIIADGHTDWLKVIERKVS